MILSKHARPGTDFDALIEKRGKEARFKIFRKHDFGNASPNTNASRSGCKSAKSNGRAQGGRQVSLTDKSSDLLETGGDSAEDSVIRPAARRRVKTKNTDASFRVALRLFRAIPSGRRSSVQLLKPYGHVFIDNSIDSAARCFHHVDQQIRTRCTHIEFHPPEDMSLQNKIRIERDSEEADKIFDQVITMLREARKFPGEPSYRTVEVEFGVDKATND